jgi:cytochrome c oxidase cbb3-type subunit 3
MYVHRKCLVGILLTVAFAFAQEGPPAGAPGGRGGRGGRGGGGAAATREFLGLGPAPDAAAAAKGAPLFKQNCATCHGETARGSQVGPNLVRSTVVLHDEKDDEIGPVIKNGRPQAGMPAFPSLSQDDIHNIAQFLKMQIELTANRGTYGQTYAGQRSQASGDPKKGEAFFNANCVSCHSAAGDLAKVGSKFPQAAMMQARFLWPSSFGPRKATVTTPTGQTVTGTIRQMDDFNVSLIDSSGEYHSWPLDKVKVQVEDKLAGHRALLPKYSDADIHDITAYLVTLK